MEDYVDTSTEASITVEVSYSRIRVPSRVEWIEKTVQFLTQHAMHNGVCDARGSYKLSVALHEALTNSVVHGNLEISSELKERDDNVFAEMLAKRSADETYASRHVEIVVESNNSWCRWSLTDHGRGFDVDSVLNKKLPDVDDPEFLLASGRGIPLMKAFMSDVHFDLNGRRVVLTLSRAPNSERPSDGDESLSNLADKVPLRPDGAIDWEVAHAAATRGLSKNHIQVLDTYLQSADKLIIELCDNGSVHYLPAEVQECTPVGDGVFQIGCKLDVGIEPASVPTAAGRVEDAVATLLETIGATAVEHHHAREHSRAVYTERLTVRVHVGDEPKHAFARDLSKSGIAFIATFPLPHRDIEIGLTGANVNELLKIRAHVVRCDEIVKGFYDVGAYFTGWA